MVGEGVLQVKMSLPCFSVIIKTVNNRQSFYTIGATSEAGTTYPTGVPELTHNFVDRVLPNL